jgi:hypothetical protein
MDGFSQIATFAGPKDREFQLVAERIKKAVQTRQLLGATKRGDAPEVRTLLKNSINVNLSNRLNQTALLIAAQNGQVECTKILLDEPLVEMDHKDDSGNTALHLAVTRNNKGSSEIVEELLKAGADMEIPNNKSKTAYRLSRQKDIDIGIRRLFRYPPLVERHSAQVQYALVKTEIPKAHGDHACKRNWVAATEIFSIRKNSNEKLVERYRTAYSTIQRFIYSDTPIEQICQEERPPDLKSEPLWRWYHIPSNNMAWVHDLFVKLKIHTNPWARHYRDGGFPHSRWMSPESVVLPNLNDLPENRNLQVLALFMPYISYEQSTLQAEMSTLMESTQKGLKSLDAQDTSPEPVFDVQSTTEDNARSHDGGVEFETTVRAFGETRDLPEQSEEKLPTPEIQVQSIKTTSTQDLSCVQADLEPQILWNSPEISNTEEHDPEAEERNTTPYHDDFDDDDDGDDDDDWRAQIEAYLTHDPPLHPRRTLDQSYYHMLPSTSTRDSDQVVARRAKKEKREGLANEWQKIEGHNVLMVDQLWLWIIKTSDDGPSMVITSFPGRNGVEAEHTRVLDNLQLNTFKTLPGQTRSPIEKPQDLVFRILTLCCKTLDRHQTVKPMQFLQFFQSTIGDAVSVLNITLS